MLFPLHYTGGRASRIRASQSYIFIYTIFVTEAVSISHTVYQPAPVLYSSLSFQPAPAPENRLYNGSAFTERWQYTEISPLSQPNYPFPRKSAKQYRISPLIPFWVSVCLAIFDKSQQYLRRHIINSYNCEINPLLVILLSSIYMYIEDEIFSLNDSD